MICKWHCLKSLILMDASLSTVVDFVAVSWAGSSDFLHLWYLNVMYFREKNVHIYSTIKNIFTNLHIWKYILLKIINGTHDELLWHGTE